MPCIIRSRAALTVARRGWNTGTGAPAHTITRTGTRSATSASSSFTGEALRGPGSKSGSRCHEQTCTWRFAPWIASAIRGSALAPSISTCIELPSRGGTAVSAHRPSVAGARARELPVPPQAAHVVMDHRVLDPVTDGAVDPIESSHGTPRTR